MAGYYEKVANILINSNRSVNLKEGQRVVSVAITCATLSANPVLIGWNEDASSGDYLLPGQSYEVVAQEGNYLDGNEIRFQFRTIDGTPLQSGTNQCLVKIKMEDKKCNG